MGWCVTEREGEGSNIGIRGERVEQRFEREQRGTRATSSLHVPGNNPDRATP